VVPFGAFWPESHLVLVNIRLWMTLVHASCLVSLEKKTR
jgi:hypothetical protein